jgi:hypothetical protein
MDDIDIRAFGLFRHDAVFATNHAELNHFMLESFIFF